jgi:2',3'-cyclic-nucleotide 2'-phosphodiesterase
MSLNGKDAVNVLAIGDIVGQSGIRALFVGLRDLIRKNGVDFVIANGENASGGFGLTPEIASSLFTMGIDVLTSGNHIWQKREIYETLENDTRLLRPANYPAGAPGSGSVLIRKGGVSFAVINLQGREDMTPINDPFKTAADLIKKLKAERAVVVIDFHAESTGEKESLALYLDGEVSAVFGTHTHVQTADERILPKGTGYITDVGMTGPDSSVIGVKTDIAIRRSLTQMPIKMENSEEPSAIHGALFSIDPESRKTVAVRRISVPPARA